MTVDRLCETCAYYRHAMKSVGQCRRYPPRTVDRRERYADYPRVDAAFWCGEWRQHPELSARGSTREPS